MGKGVLMRRQSIFLFSSSAPTITLFSDHVDVNRRPASLLASALLHVSIIGLVSYGILTAPSAVHVASDKYSVRRLDLRTPEQRRASRGKPGAPEHQAAKLLPTTSGHVSAALQQAIHAAAGPQTLLQPDLNLRAVSPQAIPLPRVMIWTPTKTEVKRIVPPRPAPPTTAETHPSVDAPNADINLADLDIASSKNPTAKLPVLPGTTSPVVTYTPSQVELPPATTSQNTAEPTPASVLSLSDLQMKDGPVTLPPVNETARSNQSGTLSGKAANGLGAGAGRGTGTGTGSGDTESNSAGPVGTPNGTPSGSEHGATTGNGAGNQASTTQITLPRDGRFGSVVVGQSVDAQFPEIAEVWSGRLAYTVYLHVGLARSWILQYSLPRDADAASAGNANRLDAPWPYAIVRPNLAPGEVNADAMMIHGFVDQSGHFEGLSMVFPQACPQAPFVLKSLEQWQFRPASQNGQSTRVEVLLIIPEYLE
jgi:hypothetical protein